MMYLVFDIPSGTSVGEFLRDIYCQNHVNHQVIATLIQQSWVSGDYYIRTYPAVSGKEGKVDLKELTPDDIATLLSGSEIGEKGQNLINPESMIFKHQS